MVLQQQKAKLQAAKRGHELLKKKSDALSVKFREILGKILDVCPFSFTHVSSVIFALYVCDRQRTISLQL
jgi:vacuolar-type H+-ATPase subunit D/Vma8